MEATEVTEAGFWSQNRCHVLVPPPLAEMVICALAAMAVSRKAARATSLQMVLLGQGVFMTTAS